MVCMQRIEQKLYTNSIHSCPSPRFLKNKKHVFFRNVLDVVAANNKIGMNIQSVCFVWKLSQASGTCELQICVKKCKNKTNYAAKIRYSEIIFKDKWFHLVFMLLILCCYVVLLFFLVEKKKHDEELKWGIRGK